MLLRTLPHNHSGLMPMLSWCKRPPGLVAFVTGASKHYPLWRYQFSTQPNTTKIVTLAQLGQARGCQNRQQLARACSKQDLFAIERRNCFKLPNSGTISRWHERWPLTEACCAPISHSCQGASVESNIRDMSRDCRNFTKDCINYGDFATRAFRLSSYWTKQMCCRNTVLISRHGCVKSTSYHVGSTLQQTWQSLLHTRTTCWSCNRLPWELPNQRSFLETFQPFCEEYLLDL